MCERERERERDTKQTKHYFCSGVESVEECSFCTVSSRVCRVSRIYRNTVDSRLHEFKVLKETA